MGKPTARLVCKNKDTGENTELVAFWPSDQVPGCHNSSKLGGKTKEGEPIEATIQFRRGEGDLETLSLGKDGDYYLNLYVEEEDDDF